MTRELQECAVEFLREAVYRSRASQAFTTAVRQAQQPGAGNCGLGERAAVVLDLSERGRALFERLFGSGANDEARLARVQGVLRDWIGRQDALDRKRNHFLKAFRQQHGFDRTRYTADELRDYDAGLAAINADEDRARAQAAELLLADRD